MGQKSIINILISMETKQGSNTEKVEEAPSIYIIKDGDSLTKIAFKSGISIAKLK